ncbi:hypothetical protein BBK36DRAFT_1124813 [Trichoderma citrinoviride]|uniref:C2H2-type domain-containing protein n=1 Tax=Trichoderma citrinoviride TaxID=58853 RepID=A0A2T4B469_9HYPO|nr:hypothetical protein BBK36DRAFT_1124813 [Trichoderma citrinoviride]PTB64123.1 hypothetical protein BBK36DRAFT_1124813 [Trichoderma citrinoviride]
MHGSDARGRRVSLLNDDEMTGATARHSAFVWPTAQSQHYAGSDSSLPNTPALLRSDSFDSQLSEAAISPLTPPGDSYYGSVRPMTYAFGRDSAASCVPERPVKRYPCRYRELHGCEKTFTTSGHASRHSKIHTAEKAVHCQYPGCHKKFTRADNMKQHLETHFKDKTRSSSGSHRTSKASLASSARRSSTASSRSMSSTTGPDSFVFWDESELRQKQSLSPTSPLSQPTRDWEPGMGGIELPLLNRPSAVGRMPSGLETLAMAVEMDCREGRGL